MVVAVHTPTQIVKRSGETVEFDRHKIESAITRAFLSVHGAYEKSVVVDLTEKVVNILAVRDPIPTVEFVQDMVVFILQANGHYDVAEHYIIYRHEHAKKREAEYIPPSVLAAFEEDKKYFPTELQRFQFYDKYSRFSYDLGRRETWTETVQRACLFLYSLAIKQNPQIDRQRLTRLMYEIEDGILNMRVMPSMRLLAMAGEPAMRDNSVIYNCAYLPLDSIASFCELMANSMAGCGVGFSVEFKNVNQLPVIARPTGQQTTKFVIEDSAEGWVTALRYGLNSWFTGCDVDFDFSLIRPKGSVLKTKGGRACLTGDTVIFRDKDKWGVVKNEMTIKQLFDLWQRGRGRSREVTIRSLNEATGEFYRNRVLNVVDNGVADVFEVTLANGYKIKATSNHRFMKDDGSYQTLDKFVVGDLMAANGSSELKTSICVDCGDFCSRRAYRCRNCSDKAQIQENVLGTSARQRKDCKDARRDICNRCGITTVNRRMEVHHKDRNPENNDPINLINYCYICHNKVHKDEDNYSIPRLQKYITYETITSIVYVGRERVYDLQMLAPNHNFVANGFVSHNSGSEPLRDLLSFIRNKFISRQGRKLTTLDCHDIACAIGNAVVSGGVRRTALISIFDEDDELMLNCKTGDFEKNNSQRWNANNSAVWKNVQDMTQQEFVRRMWTMFESERGEPGIFSRENAAWMMPQRRLTHKHVGAVGEKEEIHFGTNPCGEILLRPFQFCNLTDVIARSDDDFESLKAKVRLATIIGTIQSTATYFPNLRPIWKENCEEERLLGVGISGQLDCFFLMQNEYYFAELRKVAIETNEEFAQFLGINKSASITCVKPSGNSSVLLDCSSGLHARWSEYYIRNVRVSAGSPLVKVLQDSGYKLSPENGQDPQNPYTWVVSFPVESPVGAKVRDEWNVIQQCEWWKANKMYWTEHNPSVTIYYKRNEVLDLMNWLWLNKDYIGGMTFLPKSDAKYDQLPYIDIDAAEYQRMKDEQKPIKFERLYLHEREDYSTASQELACDGPICELPTH